MQREPQTHTVSVSGRLIWTIFDFHMRGRIENCLEAFCFAECDSVQPGSPLAMR